MIGSRVVIAAMRGGERRRVAALGHGRAVFLILLALMGCAPIRAAPGPATYAPSPTDHDSGSPEHGGGDGGDGGGGGM